MFFYFETSFRRLGAARDTFEPYFRAGTRIVLVLYAPPLILSMTLVVLGLNRNRLLFLLLSLMLVAANVDSALRVRGVEVTGLTHLAGERGGRNARGAHARRPSLEREQDRPRQVFPARMEAAEDPGAGLLSVGALVFSVFDTERFERAGEAGSPR